MKKTLEYQKLPGNSFDIGRYGKYSLWLGNDHLLHIRNRGDAEEYKRFYYRDIQSILLRKTSKGTILNVVFGFLVFIPLVVLILASTRWDWQPLPRIFFAGFGGIFLIALLLNLVRGNTCLCHLQTAVHHQELRSLSRVRSSMKTLALLIERVEQAQGFLSPEQILSVRAVTKYPARPQLFPSTAEPQIHYYDGSAHLAFFGLMVLVGLHTAVQIFFRPLGFQIWSGILGLVMLILMVLAMVKQSHSTIPGNVKKIIWLSLGWFCLSGIIASVFGFYFAFSNPFRPWPFRNNLPGPSPLDSWPLLIYYIVSASLTVLLGALGILFVLRYRSATRNSMDQMK